MKKAWFYYLLAAVLCMVFYSLGRWQLARAEWKQHKLDAVAAILKDRKPQSLSLLSKQNNTDLAWTEGRGHFVDVPALLLDNQRLGDQVGVNVYRAFLPDDGQVVLVNLGWLLVPGDRSMPKLEKITGSYELNGLFTTPPSPGLAIGPAYVKTNNDYWLLTRMPLDELSKELKLTLSPRILRLNPDLKIGYARDLDVLPNTIPPEKHRGYAVQWFGMCLASIIITMILALRRKKITEEKSND